VAFVKRFAAFRDYFFIGVLFIQLWKSSMYNILMSICEIKHSLQTVDPCSGHHYGD